MKGLLLTYLMTYGGVTAALFNPFVGVLVYASFSILRPPSLWPWAVPPGSYSQVVALGMLAGWTLRGFGCWRLGRAWPVIAALGFFACWSTLLVPFADANPDAARKVGEEMVKIILPIFVGISTIRSVSQLRALAWVLTLSQGYLALEFNLSYLSGYNRVQYEGFADLDNNGVAVSLVTSLGIAFFLGFGERRWWLKAAALGLALLMAHAVLLTFSRGGMLSMGVTGLVAFLVMPKRPAYLGAFALAALAVGSLAGKEVVERFQETFVEKGKDASADSRRNQWAACLRCMKDHPLGVGPDQWRFVNSAYGVHAGQAAHSTWMQAGVEFGAPGLAALLLYYLTCMGRLRILTREATPVPDPWFRHLARLVITALAGFLVAGQFVTLYKLEVPYYLGLIGAGLLKLSSTPPAEVPPGGGVDLRGGADGLGVAGVEAAPDPDARRPTKPALAWSGAAV